jgi:asparagine synthase (glutamine-hydrolysing)
MCGISAVIDAHASAGVSAVLRRMHAPIRHRGPDEESFLLVGEDWRVTAGVANDDAARAGLAFRRLRVIDLSDDAAQPMRSTAREAWICFNGEIYNFRSLRDELRDRYDFRSQSDTEVILAAYEKWGVDCFEHLEGMWAIVIVDLSRRRVILSRDRFGIKPLYWWKREGRLLVASEIKQILAAIDERPRPNEPEIAAFLRGNRVPTLNETFFRDIQPFPPASTMVIPLDGSPSPDAPRTFWSLNALDTFDVRERDYPQWVDRFERVLGEAVQSHNVADVNVGYLLSGGLDSSTLTAMMARDARSHGRKPAPAFSFGFRERAADVCELHHVDSVAQKLGVDVHETSLDGAWISQNAGKVMRALEEPALGIAALAQYRVFQLSAAHGMTVVIDGEASDEVLGGYPSYQVNLLRDHLGRGRLIAFARAVREMARYEDRSSLAVLSDLGRRFRSRPRRRGSWLDPAYGQNAEREMAKRAALADARADRSRVWRLLYRDVTWGNVKIVLGYTDRVSMAHSIEARVPFLDRAVVETAFALPDEFKVGNGQRKRILRDVARRYLPASVTERKDRMGFGVPHAMLMREMGADLPDRVRSVSAFPAFAGGAVEALLARLPENDPASMAMLWRVYSLARWLEEFDVAAG